MKKRVLVLGDGGFLGRAFARHKTNSAVEIISGSEMGIRLSPSTDYRQVLKSLNPNVIVNFAAVSNLWTKDVQQIFSINVAEPLRLIEDFRTAVADPHFIHLSSGYVYSPGEDIREDSPVRPANIYAASKLVMDEMHAYLNQKLLFSCARIFNALGPGQDKRYVVPKVIEAVKNHGAISVRQVDFKRDFIDSRDIASAIQLIIQRRLPGVINVCSGRPSGLMDIIRVVEQIVQKKANLVVADEDHRTAFEREYDVLVGSPSKLRANGWAPSYALEDSISFIVKSY